MNEFKIRVICLSGDEDVKARYRELVSLLKEYCWFDVIEGSGQGSEGVSDVVLFLPNNEVFAEVGKEEIRGSDVQALATKLHDILFKERVKKLARQKRRK